MKKLLVYSTALLFMACGTENPTTQENTENKTSVETAKNCTYSYNHGSTKLMWEAYKLSDKIAVGGTLDSAIAMNFNNGVKVNQVLQGAKFEVFTSSINSNDIARDQKIMDSFFGTFTQGKTIQGEVLGVDVNSDMATMRLTLNDVTKELSLKAQFNESNNELKLQGAIDLAHFNGNEALDALNKVCSERHTGPDGINKLWPDVKITLYTTLEKECE